MYRRVLDFAEGDVRRFFMLSTLVFASGCDHEVIDSDRAHLRALNAPAYGASSVDRPHVVFSSREFIIQELETPTPAPVSIGSSPSPATMHSSDPGVVSVASDGRLVAHRNGSATIRARHSTLSVHVATVTYLRIVPVSLELAAGQEATVRVEASDGAAPPSKALQWSVSNPAVATVIGSAVRAGHASGTATIEARYSGLVARAEVRVHGDGSFDVMPARARLHRGAVMAFRAVNRGGTGRVEWSAKNPDVLARVQDGIFQALAAGRTSVCAATTGRRSCAEVEVIP